MKNTIFLKDVKSNLVEEAIIVFKENVKIKEKQFIKGESVKQNSEEENIAIKEAENVILDYVQECEIEKKRNMQKRKMKILKGMNIVLVILLVIFIIF